MKKIIVFISILAAAMSCETMYGPVQTPVASDKAEGIEITVNSVADSTVSFTLTPAGEASYYSYLVDAAPEAEVLDSSLLYSVKYTGVAQKAVKWDAEAASTVVELEGLMPNTTYQIYAVAASPMGFVGSVVNTSFKTSDAVAPELDEEAWEVADTVVTLVFSENVVLADNPQIVASYYAINDSNFATATPVGTMEADSVFVEGNVVTLEFLKLPAGAYYAVNYPEGTFKDPTGNPVAALRSAMAGDMKTGETQGIGVYGRREPGTFAFGELDMENLVEWQIPLLVDFGSEYGYGLTLKAAAGEAVYEHSGKSTTLTLTGKVDFNYVDEAGCLVIMLPEEPERGDMVTVTIAADSFEDFYGNTNEEWEVSLVYSYGYTLADILGTYNALAKSAYQDMPDTSGTIVIEESDNAEKGNVMLTSILGRPATVSPVYAEFDMISGTLTIPTMQPFAKEPGYKVPISQTDYIEVDATMCFATSTNTGELDQKNPTMFRIPEPGVINGQSGLFGIMALFPYGGGNSYTFDDIFRAFEAVRDATPTPAPAPAPAPSCLKSSNKSIHYMN